MVHLVTRFGCTVALAALALLGQPVAQADDASFVAGVRALGLNEADDVLIRTGLSACRFLQPNLRRLPSDVQAHIERHLNLSPGTLLTPGRAPFPEDGKAHEFFVLAVNEYCPELAYRLPPA
jgi:hypothetical protein